MTTAQEKTAVKVVLVRLAFLCRRLNRGVAHWIAPGQGTAGFGDPSSDMARVTDLADVHSILDLFQAHGHVEVRVYNT